MVGRRIGWHVPTVLSAALILGASDVAAAQTPPPTPPASSQSKPVDPKTPLPVNVDEIRAVMQNAPTGALSMNSVTTRFYILVEGHQEIKFSKFLGSFDLKHGKVPGAAMTHGEFLDLVTPKELYSAAGIKPIEGLEFALTNAFGQFLARKAIEDIKKSNNDRQIQAIRDRITKELEALTGKK